MNINVETRNPVVDVKEVGTAQIGPQSVDYMEHNDGSVSTYTTLNHVSGLVATELSDGTFHLRFHYMDPDTGDMAYFTVFVTDVQATKLAEQLTLLR